MRSTVDVLSVNPAPVVVSAIVHVFTKSFIRRYLILMERVCAPKLDPHKFKICGTKITGYTVYQCSVCIVTSYSIHVSLMVIEKHSHNLSIVHHSVKCPCILIFHYH